MVLLTDVLESINGAFPLFSSGERHIDEYLGQFSFEKDGITQRWEMFDLLSRNVMEFLRNRYPALGELNCSICCELQMDQLRDKIERNERAYECYLSIVARHAA